MPLLQFDVIEGRKPEVIKTILDVAHNVVLEAFGVPERDRYQLVNEHKPSNMVFLDTGLGFERSTQFILLRVFTSPRSDEQKQLFMKRLAEELEKHCGIRGEDLMISFISNQKGDWSFGFGEAQYTTGTL